MEGFCVKIIGEYISNGDKELIVTKNTIVWLDIELGLSYFVGNFKDRNRYESLFLDLPTVLETKLRSLEYKSADLVQANKGKIEVFLKRMLLTKAENKNYEWTKLDGFEVYKPISYTKGRKDVNKNLINCKAIQINEKFRTVRVGYWDGE